MKKAIDILTFRHLALLFILFLSTSCDLIDPKDTDEQKSSNATSITIHAAFSDSKLGLSSLSSNSIKTNLATGSFSDIDYILINVRDDNNNPEASDQLSFDGNSWTTTLQALPINKNLHFIGTAYNSSNVPIFTAVHVDTLSLEEPPITLRFTPIDDGETFDIPQINVIHPAIVLPDYTTNFILVIKSNPGETIQYQFIPEDNGGFFTQNTVQSIQTSSNITTIGVDYTAPSIEGIYTIKAVVSNEFGNTVTNTFTIEVDFNATNLEISSEFSPIILDLDFHLDFTNLIIDATVDDDEDLSELSYAWSLSNVISDGSPTMSTSNDSRGIIFDYTVGTSATVNFSVTDKNGNGGTTTLEYVLPYDQFPSASADGQLISQSGQENSQHLGNNGDGSTTKVAQSFVPHIDGTLDYVDVYLMPSSTNFQEKIDLSLTDANFSILETASRDSYSGNGQWLRFAFSKNTPITANTEYRFIVSIRGQEDEYLIGTQENDFYSEGNLFVDDGSNSYQSQPGSDLSFKIKIFHDFDQTAPVQSNNVGVAQVFAGGNNTCVLNNDDELKCWGANEVGQLGQDNTQSVGHTPIGIANLDPINLGENLHAVQVSISQNSSPAFSGHSICAVLNDGSAKCWGNNDAGQLGQDLFDPTIGGNVGDMSSLSPIDFGSGLSAVQISTNIFHSCAVLSNGRAKCWGENFAGKLGIGDSPEDVIGDGVDIDFNDINEMGDNLPFIELGTDQNGDPLQVISIGAGEEHTCALLEDTTTNFRGVKCWGDSGSDGVLGIPVGINVDIGDDIAEMGDALPFIVFGGSSNVQSLHVSSNFNCVVFDNNELKCWGSNDNGELGQENSDPILPNDLATTNNIELGSNLTLSSMSTGLTSNCVLFTEGSLKCFGSNDNGELGLASTTYYGDSFGSMGGALPFVIQDANYRAEQVASGSAHSCALFENGDLRCWGLNDNGQLGHGNTDNYGFDTGQTVTNSPITNTGD